ncbi:MAG: hypothetical protein LC772_01370 [Chloroflexi bacterium]|nr:hypothetical protein [Chloroflexota bacterium]
MKKASPNRVITNVFTIALAGLALLGLSRPAVAADQVPFQGSLEAVVTRIPLAPPLVGVILNGTGNATHLGSFTFTAPHVVNLATRVASGSYEFAAANGDMVYADFVGHSTLTDEPGVIRIVEVATITGGTGRYASATGAFTVVRLYNTIDGTTAGSFDGTISSPGAN